MDYEQMRTTEGAIDEAIAALPNGNDRIEEEYLVKVCRLRRLMAKTEAAAIAARRRSEFEALLEKTYYSFDKDDDSPKGQLCKIAKSAAARANEELAHLAADFGMSLHPQLGPWLEVSYGESLYHAERCSAKDRYAAERKIRRLETGAASQIERTSIDTLTRLLAEDLTPAQAAELVQAIPAAAELVPEVKLEDLKWEPDHAMDPEDASGLEDVPF
jgi:hypothetical protein